MEEEEEEKAVRTQNVTPGSCNNVPGELGIHLPLSHPRLLNLETPSSALKQNHCSHTQAKTTSHIF